MSKHSATYISATATAKLVRVALKAAFPAVKFAVRTSKYSGGSSVHISYTDGPTVARVDEICRPFNGNGFDGSIDMAYGIDAWVLNGAVIGTRCGGTEGSRGYVAAWGTIAPHDDAELVHFGASVSVSRTISATLAARCYAQVVKGCHLQHTAEFVTREDGSWTLRGDNRPAFGHYYMSDLIWQAGGDATKFAIRPR